jgi:hypothetical protein
LYSLDFLNRRRAIFAVLVNKEWCLLGQKQIGYVRANFRFAARVEADGKMNRIMVFWLTK